MVFLFKTAAVIFLVSFYFMLSAGFAQDNSFAQIDNEIQTNSFAPGTAAKPTLIQRPTIPAKPRLEPIWEFGMGFGYIRFEQYPAAGEYSTLFLPFPTFQYRGKIVRADDREGAKAYLWESGPWSIEMSGTGSPTLDSDDNDLRDGMDDIPWIIAMGPQLVYRIGPFFDFGLGVFQAISTDFAHTKTNGNIFEGKMSYTYEKIFAEKKIKALTKYFLTFKAASQEIHDQYYSVDQDFVTPVRSRYRAKAGHLGTEFSVYQSLKKGRGAIYVGLNYTDYSMAENKKSPLHNSLGQLSYLFGMTYVLGESKRPEVKKENTSGIMNQRFYE